jgi:hypothetical protein
VVRMFRYVMPGLGVYLCVMSSVRHRGFAMPFAGRCLQRRHHEQGCSKHGADSQSLDEHAGENPLKFTGLAACRS